MLLAGQSGVVNASSSAGLLGGGLLLAAIGPVVTLAATGSLTTGVALAVWAVWAVWAAWVARERRDRAEVGTGGGWERVAGGGWAGGGLGGGSR